MPSATYGLIAKLHKKFPLLTFETVIVLLFYNRWRYNIT